MAGKPTRKSDKVLWVTCNRLASHSYEASNEVGGGEVTGGGGGGV